MRGQLDEWIDDLPEDWDAVKTKSLFKILKRQVPHDGQAILSITQSGIRPKNISENEGQMAGNYDGYQEVFIGDFAMNSMDLLTGWVDQSRYDGLTSPDYRVFVTTDLTRVYGRFYSYVFQTLYSRHIYYKYGQGVSNMGRWRLPAQTFLNFPLPNPTFVEQRAIVSFLDAKTAEIDGIINKLQREVQLLERYRRELIAHTVTRSLNPDVPMRDSGVEWIGKGPTSWTLYSAKALFQRRKEFERPADIHLTPSQLYGVLPQEEFINKSGTKPTLKLSEAGKMRHVEPGDFIIHLRSFQGGLELSELAGKVSAAYTVLSPRDSGLVDSGYFKWLFKSDPFIRSLASLTNQLRDGQSINFTTFSRTSYYIPSIDIQRLIAAFLDRKTLEIDSAITGIKRQIELLGKYRKQIINDAVTGKVRVGEVA